MVKQQYDEGHEYALALELRRAHRVRTDQPAYEALKASPHFGPAARGDAAARRALHVLAKQLVGEERKRRNAERAAERRKDVAVNLIPKVERRRAEVTALEYARLARDFPGLGDQLPPLVQDFRSRFFGGRPLTEEEAVRVLSSPAAALLSLERFETGEIPLLSHEATVVPSIEPDPEDESMYWERFDVTVSGHATPFTIRYGWRGHEETLPRMTVAVQGKLKRLRAYPNTLFDALRELADDLAKHYGWNQAGSVQFVLMDKPPSVPCFKVDTSGVAGFDHRHFRLELSILPWVSASTVANVYRRLQKARLGHTQNRSTTIASLALFDFVSERRHRNPSMPFREIQRKWDKTRKESAERYGVRGVQNLQRDYERIRRQIIFLGSSRAAPATPKEKGAPRASRVDRGRSKR